MAETARTTPNKKPTLERRIKRVGDTLMILELLFAYILSISRGSHPLSNAAVFNWLQSC